MRWPPTWCRSWTTGRCARRRTRTCATRQCVPSAGCPIDVIRKDRYDDKTPAALALAEIGPDGLEAMPVLIAALGDPKEPNAGIVNALTKLAPVARDARAALQRVLEKADKPATRGWVATVLWKMDKDPRALAILTE